MKSVICMLVGICMPCFGIDYVLPGGTGAGPTSTRVGDGTLYSPEGYGSGIPIQGTPGVGYWASPWYMGVEIGSTYNYTQDNYGRYSVGSVGFKPTNAPTAGYYDVSLKWLDQTGTSAGKVYWRDSTCMGWQKLDQPVGGWSTLRTNHYVSGSDYSIEFRELNNGNWAVINADVVRYTPSTAGTQQLRTLYYNPQFGLAPTASDVTLGGAACKSWVWGDQNLIFAANGTGSGDAEFDGMGTSTIALDGPVPDGLYTVKATLAKNAAFNSFVVGDSKGASVEIDSSAWNNYAFNEVTLFQNVRISGGEYTLSFTDNYSDSYAFGMIDQIILVEQVPEPATMTLLSLGMISLLRRRK